MPPPASFARDGARGGGEAGRRGRRGDGDAAATAAVAVAARACGDRRDGGAARARRDRAAVVLTLTSFVKLSVVLSLVRNAIGAPDAPSGLVVTGLVAACSRSS